MNLQRIVLVLLLSIQSGLVYAVTNDAFPQWAKIAAILLAMVGTTVQALTPPIASPAPQVKS